MEEIFPRQITSEDQQEVLRLLCRAHELQPGNTHLQANAPYRENLVCQKDFVISNCSSTCYAAKKLFSSSRC